MWPERTVYVEVILNKARRGFIVAELNGGVVVLHKNNKAQKGSVVV